MTSMIWGYAHHTDKSYNAQTIDMLVLYHERRTDSSNPAFNFL